MALVMTAQGNFKPIPSPRWSIGGLSSPNSNMKHYKSIEMLSNFQNVKSPSANVKPPIRLSGDGSGLNLTSFRATVSLHLIRSGLKK